MTDLKIRVRVTARSKEFRIQQKDGLVAVWLRSAPEEGKANRELVRELRKAFKADEVRIISGRTSRNKVLLVKGAREESPWKKN